MIPKRLFRHAEIPRDIKKVKNADVKIWSFLAKNSGLTPWKKVDFLSKFKYSFYSFHSNQCVRKSPLRHLSASQETSDKEIPKQDEVSVRLKQKNSLSGRYLHLKIIPKRLVRDAEIPRDINK